MRAARALAGAICAGILLTIAACGNTPRATVATCTAEIVAHPDESAAGPGCKGLSQDQLWQATIAAMQQGAVG